MLASDIPFHRAIDRFFLSVFGSQVLMVQSIVARKKLKTQIFWLLCPTTLFFGGLSARQRTQTHTHATLYTQNVVANSIVVLLSSALQG